MTGKELYRMENVQRNDKGTYQNTKQQNSRNILKKKERKKEKRAVGTNFENLT